MNKEKHLRDMLEKVENIINRLSINLDDTDYSQIKSSILLDICNQLSSVQSGLHCFKSTLTKFEILQENIKSTLSDRE